MDYEIKSGRIIADVPSYTEDDRHEQILAEALADTCWTARLKYQGDFAEYYFKRYPESAKLGGACVSFYAEPEEASHAEICARINLARKAFSKRLTELADLRDDLQLIEAANKRFD